MVLTSKTEIAVRQIIEDRKEITFVEFYSVSDSRNHILSADTFCDVFGYTLNDLRKISKETK